MGLAQIAMGPRVRKSPFFEANRKAGVNAFSVYNHMYLPLWYESPEADFWHLIEHVSLWDVGVERQVEISGPDAFKLAQYMSPRDLSRCAVGQCKYVMLCDETGAVINDPVMLRVAEDRFWFSLADSDILLWAKAFAVSKGFDVTVREPDVSPLQVQGPKSRDVMLSLLGDQIADLKYFWFIETVIANAPVLVSRTGWSSEFGYEIFLMDSRFGDAVWDAIMEAGAPFNIKPGSPNTIRRIEGGMYSLGSDMGFDGSTPLELGFERLIDLDGDFDFVGKSALLRQRSEGIKRRMVGVELDGDPMPAGNESWWPLSQGDRVVGKITSAIHSPRLKKNIALAMLDVECAGIGTVLDAAADLPRTATVCETPFYDPKKEIAKG